MTKDEILKDGQKHMKGYKVFNSDWTCRDFQFEVGKTFTEDVTPVCCERGFHFCTKAADCFRHYSFDPNNKVAEVEALGDIDTNNGDSKCCTNKIHIIREITWQEVLDLVNLGKACTGLCNSGDYNTGDCNSGDRNTGNYNSGDRNTGNCNTGNCNTGDWNTGNYNTGDCNSGDRNSGNYNTGNWNTGDWNSGDRNTGDWNKSSFNTGCFNTEEQKIMLFNKPSDMTHNDWLRSDARHLLNEMPKDVVEWVYDMTDEEKAAHPTYETTGGYLKVLDESECGQLWWSSLSDLEKEIIKAIPNFDAKIFFQCTGVRVDE